ncbi:MAG: 3'-5' exonuclease [Anaeromyxobacter sp.]|nr:3'-5' exonuclease [Anaeromyxobacter sp.]MBL0275705.1 3'-5' exonuclease [Anaeromyxobacter sp.]
MLFHSPAWDSVVYWSLDIETGGLDAKRDPILAVGMLPVRAGILRLGEAYQSLIRPEAGRVIKPESVRAHQLVQGEVDAAPALGDVLLEVDRRLREGALLVHHQAIDVVFLKRAYARLGRTWPKPPVVDTVELIHKLDRKTRFIRPADAQPDVPSTNLSETRRRHGLPDYQAHDALTDAIATAELFLVLREALHAKTLRDL